MLLYRANFAKPLPQNILDLVKAKWVEASAEVTGGAPLPPFKAFKLSRPKDPHFPGLAVYRRATRGITETGNCLLNSAPEFAVELADEGANEEELLKRLETRVEVVDAIIRTACVEEPHLITKDFPATSRALVTIDIPEHVFGQNVPQGTKNIRVAALTLIAGMVEP